MKSARLIRIVSLAATVAMAAPAVAQNSAGGGDSLRSPGGLYDATEHTRANQLSLWGGLGFYRGLGLGVRYEMPLMHDGFLPELNESVELEFGGDFYLGGGFLGASLHTLNIPVEGRWTFHLIPNFSAYLKIAVGLEVQMGSFSSPLYNTNIGPFYNIGPGIEYQLGSLTLRAEAGNRGVKVGVGFAF